MYSKDDFSSRLDICMDAENIRNDCSSMKNIGQCSSDAEHFNNMKQNCKQSCCPYWKSQGYCNSDSQYFDFMLVNCKQSCGKCGAGNYAFAIPACRV